jgi:signal transduction histidine kinase
MASDFTDKTPSRLELLSEAVRRADERATAGQLALEVIHEIRNPLEALANLLYLANLEANDCEPVRRYLALAEEQIITVNRIANQTLSYAKVHLSPSPTDLAGVAEAALRIQQQAISARKVNLVKDLPEKLEAKVYTSEILQVISNMVGNAIDAVQEGGTVCLRLRKSQGKVRILIVDNGHGIPKEHLSEIFEPFFTTKADRGTGLGLALSKSIVERHQGKIRVRSSAHPGKSGTAFRISLPA